MDTHNPQMPATFFYDLYVSIHLLYFNAYAFYVKKGINSVHSIRLIKFSLWSILWDLNKDLDSNLKK